MDDDRVPRRIRPQDAAVAVVLTLLIGGGALSRPGEDPAWWIWLLAAAICVPLAAWRRWPVPVFAISFGAALLTAGLGFGPNQFIGPAVALYGVATTVPRPEREPTRAIGVFSTLALFLGLVTGSRSGAPGGVPASIITAALLAGGWTIGRSVQERRAAADRAARELAERAVVEERLRIARELHDVVSHTLSLIGVKAGVANHVADSRPEEVRDALRVIETTSRDAMAEMSRLLGVLRTGPAAPDLEPAPGLAELPALADRARAAGVTVDLAVRGADRLPRSVELSTYRIVQEALTNVVRHAGPVRCRVLVDVGPEGVRIEVTDEGDGRPATAAPPGPGHGLVGMRERATAHGGTIAVGPRPGGGFAVAALLPAALE